MDVAARLLPKHLTDRDIAKIIMYGSASRWDKYNNYRQDVYDNVIDKYIQNVSDEEFKEIENFMKK